MAQSFESVWDAIGRQLSPGMIVENWGKKRGYTRATFEITSIEPTAITVAGSSMQMPRRISKGEFEKVHGVWESYVAGNYPRSRMSSLSQNTTYILSIFRTVLGA